MGERAERAQRIELPDGTEVWARLAELHPSGPEGEDGHEDEYGGYGGYEDVGALDRVVAKVEDLRELVTGVAASLRDAVATAAPHEVSVVFGVELAVKAGRIVSVLADGEARSSIAITLTWHNPPAEPHG
ncbi:CU044_2847 family protein [Actinacidiphila oryziradicis]|uniref:Trypsin-co-occurring domain-containing protein n=1 Tax=Actinacidiphila oryziradicis TaxID=2571141 RepID=A0A4U0SKX8_9ACTN|nr:CU044_2847 family protein [Actinacidiphila oryziradicis]TKA10504.1 hypothetical protein FCI23_16025 [Actinacidiphila oryziradicis]